MSRRRPAAPPVLPGLRPLQHLGSGGFADVYLYEQELPRRRVAVKVLVDRAVVEGVRERFVSEANAMAQLSAHPSIVTIFGAGVAPDGRLYLVMEYCSRPNLAVRFRREQIPVAEALQIGVRLASAVETAHQGGILHRDIKPANVLVTDYGWPALTDFGISAQVDTVADQAVGLSVLWSAPEMFDHEPRSDRRTDVYALGATVYALVAGRSPFELEGDNSASAVVSRIERAPVPGTGRSDGSAQLEQVLARALHKRAEARPRSALELAQALQGVERQMGLVPTSIDVRESLVLDHVAEEADQTRARGVVEIADEPSRGHSGASTGWTGSTAPAVEEAPEPAGGRRGTVVALAVAAVVVGVVAGSWLFGPRTERADDIAPPDRGPTDVVAPQRPDPPQDVGCRLSGQRLDCAWTPVAGEDVRYRWGFSETPARTTTIEAAELSTDLPDGLTPCVDLTAVVAGRVSEAVVSCAG